MSIFLSLFTVSLCCKTLQLFFLNSPQNTVLTNTCTLFNMLSLNLKVKGICQTCPTQQWFWLTTQGSILWGVGTQIICRLCPEQVFMADLHFLSVWEVDAEL